MVMRRNVFLLGLVAVLAIVFFSCSQMPKRPVPKPEPVVRVGLLNNAELATFEPMGKFRIVQKDGPQYVSEESGDWKVELKSAEQAELNYRIILYTTSFLDRAQDFENNLNLSGKTTIKSKGDVLKSGDMVIAGKESYTVEINRDFDSESAAKSYAQSMYLRDYTVKANNINHPTGILSITSPSGGKVEVKNSFRLTGSPIKVKNINVGTGFHWAHKEDRVYEGETEFRLNNAGKMAVINVLTLERYIEGVLPGEMTASFPIEALKAQAICARTFFLSHFGKNHQNDPFDVCDDVHCQVFVGVTKYDQKIRKAVQETKGFVLRHDGQLCSTPYAGVCGGHTENSENVWIGDGEPYLKGVFDLEQKGNVLATYDLSDEANLEKWVKSRPTVFCNSEMNGNPKFAQYSKKYFRWSYKASRKDFEKNIKTKTGEDIGTLLDLVPVERGKSGRIIRLRIVGSKKTITIGKELRIRQALSPKTLYSGAFTVDKLPAGTDIPREFVLNGAGWGHGVGMCQIGAGVMAEKGYPDVEILKHYYTDAKVEKMY